MRRIVNNFMIAAGGMIAVLVFMVGSSAQGPETTATRERPLHIQAQAYGQAQQLGKNFGVNIIIQEYSTADDQKALFEAFAARHRGLLKVSEAW